MSINEKKPLFVRIAGERQPNLLPVTASAVGFDFNRDRFVFYHTASDDWTDISPDGVDFVGSVYADNFFAAGVVTASLGLSGSLTQLADGTSYLIAGAGIDIASASNGAVTVSALSMMQPEYWQSSVAGEIFTTGSALVGGFVTASLGFSGSLTQLADGTSYLIAGNGIEISSASNGPVTVSKHLRDLITFIDQGPACGFPSGYKEQGPAGPFPTQSVWYTDASKTNKIVELIVTWSGPVPSSETWRAYRSDGVTVDCTVVDTFTYVGSIFEETRTRAIT